MQHSKTTIPVTYFAAASPANEVKLAKANLNVRQSWLASAAQPSLATVV